MSELIKWSEDRLMKMEKWRIDNEKTVKETAEHFKIPTQKYANARFRILTAKGKKSDNKTKSAKKPKFIDIQPATAEAPKQVVVIKCDIKNLSSVLAQL